MKKRAGFFLIAGIILLSLTSFISASFFSDFFGSITGRAVADCTDSDGGFNYNFNGTACLNGKCYSDTCTSSTGLKEYGCTIGIVTVKIYNCPDVCSNGACVSCINYYYDSDNDGYGTSSKQCLVSASGNYRATRTGDCNDAKYAINPSITEICNDGVDNNCNALAEEGCTSSASAPKKTQKSEENFTLPIPLGANTKIEDYSAKEVFLISDKEWKNVLSFVPVAIWTNDSGAIKKYPFLIYHEENFGFDADSIIYFMQQYTPDRATIIGNIPPRLDRLLKTKGSGAGFSETQIKRISAGSYLSYWTHFDKLIYSENNYEVAILASTYASLINAPLIIAGSAADSKGILSGRKSLCVGNVNLSRVNCTESYSLEQLQQKYFDETQTNKIILINPDDLASPADTTGLTTEKGGLIYDLYEGNSLSAPILASAKHELILSTHKTDYLEIDNFAKQKITQFGSDYLTVVAASNAIPHKRGGTSNSALDAVISKINKDIDSSSFGIAIDPHDYADINEDGFPDVAVGRISGFSDSDVSSYIARVLFYDKFAKTNNMKFMGSAFQGILSSMVLSISKEFKKAGYNAVAVTSEEEIYAFGPNEWANQDLILYTGHGAYFWAGIYSQEIPKLSNSFVVTPTCATIESFGEDSFWAYAMRQGAIAYSGAVTPTFLSTSLLKLLNKVYYNKQDIGTAFKNSYSAGIFQSMMMLVGDPTLNVAPPQLTSSKGMTTSTLKEEISDNILDIAKEVIFCENTDNSCGFQPNCIDCTSLAPTDLVCRGKNIMGRYSKCWGNAGGCQAWTIRSTVQTCANGCSNSGGAHCKTCTGGDFSCATGTNYRCYGGNLQRKQMGCGQDGKCFNTGWDLAENCGAYGCKNSKCVTPIPVGNTCYTVSVYENDCHFCVNPDKDYQKPGQSGTMSTCAALLPSGTSCYPAAPPANQRQYHCKFCASGSSYCAALKHGTWGRCISVKCR